MARAWRHQGKRLFDAVTAAALLLLIFPVLLLVGIVLFCFNDRQVFFLQERPGYRQKTFRIIKFKTMSDRRDDQGRLLPDKDRMTTLGSWIRNSSLDELPQLINVLLGHMSLVGPRPLLMEYLPFYNAEQQRRHEVRPGITGWAQINGRNGISWEEKFHLDVWYVDHCSIALDMKILLLTLSKVLRRSGISQKDHVSMEPFRGTV
jgi:lipopolysaccharide/colanic/teichoic acid biosynthesis glycosyltransferase